ncbi:hypothetical protein L248_0647 [Schleiferilactobacillus shenzhenensis LY-73]|uniref:Uncharacterized protein n=1 Tax=Schleiferilactobacillus shenzhenensis LY-73 TaxID=1231336 RepID=U4TS51_9LACO|nr:hypothetical protein L248_0647 [Schleiferilactobacillus shenzhenensis LY-73]
MDAGFYFEQNRLSTMVPDEKLPLQRVPYQKWQPGTFSL